MVNNNMNPPKSEKICTYKAGDQEVKLSTSTVRKYLVSGSVPVTDQEVVMFINLCKYQGLNPFLKEAYLIKYSSSMPATIVTGKDAIIKRAHHNAHYKGEQAGVVVSTADKKIEHRIGSLVAPDEELLGGWAKVYVDGYVEPIEISVGLDEYIVKTKDGKANQQWANKPGTMIRKVALVQALREAFPDNLEGMYSSEELGTNDIEYTDIPDAPVEDEMPEIQENPNEFITPDESYEPVEDDPLS